MPTLETRMAARNGFLLNEPIYRRCTKMPVSSSEDRSALVDELKDSSLAVLDRFVLVTPDDKVCVIAADELYVMRAEDGIKPLPVYVRLERDGQAKEVYGTFAFPGAETIQGYILFHTYVEGDEERRVFFNNVGDLMGGWLRFWRDEVKEEPDVDYSLAMLHASFIVGFHAAMDSCWDEEKAVQAIADIFDEQEHRSSVLSLPEENSHFIARDGLKKDSL